MKTVSEPLMWALPAGPRGAACAGEPVLPRHSRIHPCSVARTSRGLARNDEEHSRRDKAEREAPPCYMRHARTHAALWVSSSTCPLLLYMWIWLAGVLARQRRLSARRADSLTLLLRVVMRCLQYMTLLQAGLGHLSVPAALNQSLTPSMLLLWMNVENVRAFEIGGFFGGGQSSTKASC
eukprot:355287-Chlamydomonas_euryale.AAC.4